MSNLVTAGITLNFIDKASAALTGAVSRYKKQLGALHASTTGVNDKLLTQGAQALQQAQTYAQIARATSVGAGALIGFQTLNLNEFMKYEKGMAYISTLVDDARFNFNAMGKDIMSIARQTGLELSDVQRAVYQAISSNIDPNMATSFISDISQAALAGGVGIETAMNPVVTVLNAYGLSADKAMWVSDKLFQTVKVGRVEFNQLSDTVAEFAQTGALGGLAIEELLGAFATLTNVGITPAEAATAINRFVLSVIDANDESIEFAKTKNIAFDFSHLKEVGIVEFLNEIQEATHGDIIEIQKLFPEIRAFKGVAPLVGSAADMFKEFTKSVYDANGTTAKGADKMASTLANKYDRLKQDWKTLMVNMGAVTYEALEKPLNNVINWLEKASEDPKIARKISTGLNVGIGVLGGTAMISTLTWIGKTIQGAILLMKGLGVGKAIGAVAGSSAGLAGGAAASTAILGYIAGKQWQSIAEASFMKKFKTSETKFKELSGIDYNQYLGMIKDGLSQEEKLLLEGKAGGKLGDLYSTYQTEQNPVLKEALLEQWQNAVAEQQQALKTLTEEYQKQYDAALMWDKTNQNTMKSPFWSWWAANVTDKAGFARAEQFRKIREEEEWNKKLGSLNPVQQEYVMQLLGQKEHFKELGMDITSKLDEVIEALRKPLLPEGNGLQTIGQQTVLPGAPKINAIGLIGAQQEVTVQVFIDGEEISKRVERKVGKLTPSRTRQGFITVGEAAI